jgi:hypothetical protein
MKSKKKSPAEKNGHGCFFREDLIQLLRFFGLSQENTKFSFWHLDSSMNPNRVSWPLLPQSQPP